jgi:hypothetical protein
VGGADQLGLPIRIVHRAQVAAQHIKAPLYQGPVDPHGSTAILLTLPVVFGRPLTAGAGAHGSMPCCICSSLQAVACSTGGNVHTAGRCFLVGTHLTQRIGRELEHAQVRDRRRVEAAAGQQHHRLPGRARAPVQHAFQVADFHAHVLLRMSLLHITICDKADELRLGLMSAQHFKPCTLQACGKSTCPRAACSTACRWAGARTPAALALGPPRRWT